MSASPTSWHRKLLIVSGALLVGLAALLSVPAKTSDESRREGLNDVTRSTGPAERLGAAKVRRETRVGEDASRAVPSIAEWSALLDNAYRVEGLVERAELTGGTYTVGECIGLEKVMNEKKESEWDTKTLFHTIGMQVAERFPDEFLQQAIETWLTDASSTAFADDLIKQSIIREISAGQERGWQALENIAKRSAAEPERNDLRYLILHRALVEVGSLNEGQHLERVLGLWTPDAEYSRDDLRERAIKASVPR